MLGNLGFGELMVIMLIVLVLFGAKRIPEISASFGKGIREFKKNLNEVEGAIAGRDERLPYDARPPIAAPPRGEPVARPAEEARSEPKRLM